MDAGLVNVVEKKNTTETIPDVGNQHSVGLSLVRRYTTSRFYRDLEMPPHTTSWKTLNYWKYICHILGNKSNKHGIVQR